MKRLLFIIWQCTWGLPQTILGAIFWWNIRHYPTHFYRGCLQTQWSGKGGLSLGLFIFTCKEGSPNYEKIRVHEYGHCIQSLVLGPFYLILGLISVCWANIPYFRKLRKEKNIPYTSCFVESWASKWGELVTREEAIWN
jgi:uncharacterized membrane protein